MVSPDPGNHSKLSSSKKYQRLTSNNYEKLLKSNMRHKKSHTKTACLQSTMIWRRLTIEHTDIHKARALVGHRPLELTLKQPTQVQDLVFLLIKSGGSLPLPSRFFVQNSEGISINFVQNQKSK